MYPNQYDDEDLIYEEGGDYTARELEVIADRLLREDSRSELCRECGGRGRETGEVETKKQPVKDGAGTPLNIDFPEYKCNQSHIWYAGEGRVRGIAGENPILFEEHFQSRKRREIYTSLGTPDPSIVAGIYNRTHPNGRRVNSDEQRKKKMGRVGIASAIYFHCYA